MQLIKRAKMPLIFLGGYIATILLFAVLFLLANFKGISNFGDALYFSIVTITTLGYGDITPSSSFQKLLVSIETLLGISIFGAFLTMLSIEIANQARDDEQRKERERRQAEIRTKLSGRLVLLSPVFETLNLSTMSMVGQEWEKRDELKEFSFPDLAHLFDYNRNIRQNFMDPAYVVYIRYQKTLVSELRQIITDFDRNEIPEIYDMSVAIVTMIQNTDFSDAILGFQNMRIEDKNLWEDLKVSIERHEDEPTFKPANILNPFVALYQQIKYVDPMLKLLEQHMTLRAGTLQ